MNNQRTALVLGAAGGIGSEVTKALIKRGWAIKALCRQPVGAKPSTDGIAWIQGDAMNPGDVLQAAEGTCLIVHAVNPPGYRNWGQLVLPMLDNSIAAARKVNARILLPGTVYNYGPDVLPHIDEDSPQNPMTRKGAIRVEMERRLAAASRDGVRTLIVRAGDFFGPNAANNWFSQGLVKPNVSIKTISNPGKRGLGHQWAYLPDVAETMCRLVEQDESLPTFATFHMEGHWDADGTQMVEAIRRVAREANPGQEVRIKAFAWWLMMAIAPFVTTLREMKEMRYLWQQPVRMSNARLLRKLGNETHTPLDVAVRMTLEGLGCLPALETEDVSAIRSC